MAISDSLGASGELVVPAGTIHYRTRGSGPALVFVHGASVNGDLWRNVVPPLAERYRCITPDWPLGAHSTPMRADADLTPPGVAQIIIDFVEALDEEDVTLVANDSGTALAQLVLVRERGLFRRVVLTHGAAFTHFFPPASKPLVAIANTPGALRALGLVLRTTRLKRLGYKPVSHSLRDPAIIDSYVDPPRFDPLVRRDLAKFMGSVRSRYTIEAAPRLSRFRGPVLVVWGPGDRVFPMSLAERLVKMFDHAELATIDGTRALIPEDQPEALVSVLRTFLARTDANAGQAREALSATAEEA